MNFEDKDESEETPCPTPREFGEVGISMITMGDINIEDSADQEKSTSQLTVDEGTQGFVIRRSVARSGWLEASCGLCFCLVIFATALIVVWSQFFQNKDEVTTASSGAPVAVTVQTITHQVPFVCFDRVPCATSSSFRPYNSFWPHRS